MFSRKNVRIGDEILTSNSSRSLSDAYTVVGYEEDVDDACDLDSLGIYAYQTRFSDGTRVYTLISYDSIVTNVSEERRMVDFVFKTVPDLEDL